MRRPENLFVEQAKKQPTQTPSSSSIRQMKAFELGLDASHKADIEWLIAHSSKLRYGGDIVIDAEDWEEFIEGV